MNYITHNNTEIDINESHLQGYITAKYRDLVALFGAPTTGDGHKVDAEWNIQFEDETIATIYNWKNGRNYNRDSGDGLDVEYITDWNIGGFNERAVELIKQALENCEQTA